MNDFCLRLLPLTAEEWKQIWARLEEIGRSMPMDPSKLTLADIVAGHEEPPLPSTEEVNRWLNGISFHVGNNTPIDFKKAWDEMESLSQPTPGAILTDGPADAESAPIMKGQETRVENHSLIEPEE